MRCRTGAREHYNRLPDSFRQPRYRTGLGFDVQDGFRGRQF